MMAPATVHRRRRPTHRGSSRAACPDARTVVLPSARNAGIELSSGRVGRVPRLRRHLAAAQARAPTRAHVGDGQIARPHRAARTSSTMRFTPLKLRRCVPVDNPLLTFLRFQNLPNAASSWVVRRSLIDEIGPFNTDLVILEDWEFSLQAGSSTRIRSASTNRSRSTACIRGTRAAISTSTSSPASRFSTGSSQTPPSCQLMIRARKREIYARFYTMLCGGMFRVGRWGACASMGVPRVAD